MNSKLLAGLALVASVFAFGCAGGDGEGEGEEDLDVDESALSAMSNVVKAGAPTADRPVAETVAHDMRTQPADAAIGVGQKARVVFSVTLTGGGQPGEQLHVLANLAVSRCNKDDVTGNGSNPNSPCTGIQKTWGAKSYPYDPVVFAEIQLLGKNGAIKDRKQVSLRCTAYLHHCPLDLALAASDAAGVTKINLVVAAKVAASTKTTSRDVVELEREAPTGSNPLSKSALHVVRIAPGYAAPAIANRAQAPVGCTAPPKIEVRTSTSSGAKTAVAWRPFTTSSTASVLEADASVEIVETDAVAIEPLVSSQLVVYAASDFDAASGQPIAGAKALGAFSANGGKNCVNGKCVVSRKGTMRAKIPVGQDFLGAGDYVLAYMISPIRAQKNHNGKPITGTHHVAAKSCAFALTQVL